MLADVDCEDTAIVSKVTLHNQAVPDSAYRSEDGLNIGAVIEVAAGEKCQRCWKVLEEVGQQTVTDLCQRCTHVIDSGPTRQATTGS